MISSFTRTVMAVMMFCFVARRDGVAEESKIARSLPLIHCTDLLYPPDDPDDWFDLACVYSIIQFDIKCVVLDQGEKQKDRPGTVPVEMLNALTGRQIPSAVGLSRKFQSATHTGEDEPAEFQQGVEAILKTLRETTVPVVINVVGSARDVAAAFNRQPGLLREKVKAICVFAGEASHPQFIEWNVKMDPLAYAVLMRSGLPIYWLPCFDGGDFKNNGNASYWKTTQGALLEQAPDPLLQFFICATQTDATSHPLEFLRQPVDPERKKKLFETPRNMWGGVLLGRIANRIAARGSSVSPNYEFRSIRATFDDRGVVQYPSDGTGNEIMRFHVNQPDRYGTAMTSGTATLLGGSIWGK